MTTSSAADHWERKGRNVRRRAAFDALRDGVRKGFAYALIAILVVAGLALGGIVGFVLAVITGLIPLC